MPSACLSEPITGPGVSGSIARDFYPRLIAQEMRELESHGGQLCNFVTLFSSLENFQRDLQQCHDATDTLALAQLYLQSLGLFQASAFFLSEPPEWEFQLATCLPPHLEAEMKARVKAAIEAGTFAWALRQSRSLAVQPKDASTDAPLILHSLGTRSGVLGMFAGLPLDPACKIKNLPLSLLSIILTNTACALENLRLRSEVQRHNESLQQKVDERTRQLSSANAALRNEIDERQRAAETLATRTEQLAVTLRSIGDGVITTDTAGRVTMMNPSAEKLTGWAAAEAVGQTLKQIFAIVDARAGSARADWLEQVLQTDGPTLPPQNILLTDRRGHERLVAASAAPLHHSSQTRLGTVLVFRDVTVQERMAREMLKASKLESLTLLAGGIAHDFNNILTAVIGNLTLAATYPEDPKLTAWLSEANKASLRARDLTQQLLTFAKGGVPVKKTARLQETIREATQFALHGANVRARFALPENLWPAEADTGQLSQVIHNLVLNAVQAMPGGGEIHVRAENLQLAAESPLPLPGGQYVKISIQDQGCGIEPANLPRIFDPFFTTKKSGNGLGLATCYSIIKKHHGHITLDSTLDAGTTFHIFLPASDKPASAVPVVAFSQPARARGRLLVMEDDPALRTCIHSMLNQLGCKVCLARDSEETLRSYRAALRSAEAFDAVILDLTIRGGGGARETLEKLRAENPGVKAIISTGYANDPAVESFQHCGFSGVITKPYTLEQLATVLKQMLPADEKSRATTMELPIPASAA